MRLGDGDVVKVGATELVFLFPLAPGFRRAALMKRALIALTAGVALCASPAIAAPTVVSTRPVADDIGAKVHFLIGGIEESGRSLKTTDLTVSVDGQPAPPIAVQTLSDWAAASAEASSSFRPSAAIGLVYLWIEGVPSAVLDGIHSFFQRIPSRTVVYPTIYGRMRQGRARLTAGDISRLDEVPYLDGYRPNLIDAIKLNAADLAADPAALKGAAGRDGRRDFAIPRVRAPATSRSWARSCGGRESRCWPSATGPRRTRRRRRPICAIFTTARAGS